MSVNQKAKDDEKNAFKKLMNILGNPESFAAPAGDDTAFPDFGFTVYVNKKRVDLHFEYKNSSTAQMGSMRNWTFDGKKFDASDAATDPNKQQLLEVMNSSRVAMENGKRLLEDFQNYFDNPVRNKRQYNITKISSGMLSAEKNKDIRRKRLINFVNNTENYQVANIEDAILGQKILDHYHKKFHANLNRGAAASILFMMIGNQFWFIEETGSISREEKLKICEMFGVKSIPVFPRPKAKLEVRIQPRHIDKPSTPVSIDVMASFRLSGKPSGGVNI
jgi:hypothetical protein